MSQPSVPPPVAVLKGLGPGQRVRIGVGSAFCLIGGMVLAWTLSFGFLAAVVQDDPRLKAISNDSKDKAEIAATQPAVRLINLAQVPWHVWTSMATGAVLCIVGGAVVASVVFQLQSGVDERAMTIQYLVGVGFGMTTLGLLTAIIMAGFARNGLLVPLLKQDILITTPILLTLLMLTLPGLAIYGALFFIANSLWERLPAKVPFDRSYFWAGFWFRMGEALLFALVLLLIYLSYAEEPNMLFVATGCLFVGMFLKSGERLVFGLSKRFFEAFATLVPTASRDQEIDVFRFQIDNPGEPNALENLLSELNALNSTQDVQLRQTVSGKAIHVRSSKGAIQADEIVDRASFYGVVLTPL